LISDFAPRGFTYEGRKSHDQPEPAITTQKQFAHKNVAVNFGINDTFRAGMFGPRSKACLGKVVQGASYVSSKKALMWSVPIVTLALVLYKKTTHH
jgi:hypothetical protein